MGTGLRARHNWVRDSISAFVLLCTAGLLACVAATPFAQPLEPTATLPSSTLAPPSTLPLPILTREPPTRTPPATPSLVTVTLWTTEELAPGATPAGQVLKNQLDAFTAAHPYIRIEVVLKKPYGKGGMLDFLLTTSAVLPTQLPDLVTLDVVEVPVAARANLLQPLELWLPDDLKKDFFPFAFRAAHYQNRWVTVPFVLDTHHLVYNKAIVKKPPATWDEFLKQKTAMLLPLAGDDAFVLQYLALASTGDGFMPLPTDAARLTQVLTFFKRARDLNLLPETAITVKGSDEAWQLFATNQVAMVQVAASRYLAERDRVPQAAFAAVPTRDGKIATVTSGWAFAMVTRDPVHQAAATRLIQWLMQSDRLALWLRAARRLPATRAMLPLVIEPPEYAAFLRETLEQSAYWAAAMPHETQAANAWRAAIAAVWKGTTTPEDAARNIVAAIK